MAPRPRKRARGPKLRDVDTLFSRYIRARDTQCRFWMAMQAQHVACNGNLQAAHVISRRYHGTRYNPGNAMSLCQAHHLWQTHHPLEGDDAFRNILGDKVFDELRARAIVHRGKLDLKAIAADLRVKLAEQADRVT